MSRGAPAEELPVPHLSSQGIACPAVPRLGRDRVDVPVQEQAPALSRSLEPGDELGPALEAEAVRKKRVAGEVSRIGLPDLHLGSCRPKTRTEVLLELNLLPRRVLHLPGRRVEADQLGGERDEIVATARDRIDDPLLSIAQRHGVRS